MKLIVISSSKKDENEPHKVTRLFEAGLNTFHLRKPQFSTRELRDYLQEIPAHFHNRIILHSHYSLAYSFDLKGLHFSHRRPSIRYGLKWKLFFLGFKRPHLLKTGSYTQLSAVYHKDKMNYDYCFMSPMFHPLTGELQNGYYDDGITAAIQKAGKLLVARGGVTDKTIRKIYQLGFYGAAVSSYLWTAQDPLANYLRLLEVCRQQNIPVE